MRSILAFTFLCLSCLTFAQQASERNLATVRAMKFAAPKKWAVVIGASDYVEFGPLKYARNDAKEFAAALVDDFTFKPDDVTLLVDKEKPEVAPTTANIIAGLDRVFADKRLDKGDLFIFYFSGHGVATKKGDFLCPTDATKQNVEQVGLPIREVMKRIVGAGLKNVLVICDACRAGEQNPFGAELQELGNKANIAVLLGCAPGRRSYEYKSLKHGVFTHFLLEDMKDESLRQPLSGALWASAIADRLKKQVHEYTEPDHGKFAQQPATWNEKTQDVLLASFAPTIESVRELTISSFESVKQVNASVYCTLLHAMALSCMRRGWYSHAIDFLKIVEQLGEMTPKRRQSLAICLVTLDRESEAARVYDQIIASETGYFRDQAILFSPSPKITFEEKAKAADSLWKVDRSFASAVMARTLAMGEKDKARLLQEFLQTFKPDSKEWLYFRAQAAQREGRTADSVAALWAAIPAPGDSEVVDYALRALYSHYVALSDKEGQLRVLSSAIGQKEDQFYWAGELAAFYKDALNQPDKAIALLHRALRSGEPKDPGRVLMMVDTAGLRAHELVADLEAIVADNPYSWELQTALWLAKTSADLKPDFQFSEEMKKYAPDPVQLRMVAFSSLDLMLHAKNVDGETRTRFYTSFYRSLNVHNKQFQPDLFLWGYLQLWAESAQLTTSFWKLAEARLFPAVLAGKADAALTGRALTIAINAGDDGNVERIWKVAAANGAMKTDEAWRYLCYVLVRGRTKEAEALLPKMPGIGRDLDPKLPVIVRAYLDALAGGDTKKLQAMLDANPPTGVEGTYLWVLANGVAGRPELATAFFKKVIGKQDESFLYLHAAGLEWLWRDAVLRKDRGGMLLWADTAARYYGNPLFARITYQADATVADYAGTYQLEAIFSDESGVKRKGVGKLTITIKTDGTAVGKMDGLSFSGKVDKGGNLIAAGKWDGDAIWLSTKMAPLSVYQSFKEKTVQPVVILDQNLDQILMELTRVVPK